MRSENVRSAVVSILLVFSVTAAKDALAQPEGRTERGDQIQLTSQKHAWDLSWSDTEESLKGVMTPETAREGEPLKISLTVGSFYGEPFKGPVTIALRPDGMQGAADTKTVVPEGGAWTATFVPQSSGPHVVDVSFRTTRLKVLHAKINVDPARLPRSIAWGIAGALVLIVVAFGAFSLLRRSQPSPPASPPTVPPAA